MRIKVVTRDFLSCCSLANLVMLKVWLTLLPFDPGNSFFLSHSPANGYLAAMIDTVLIALSLWCAVFLAKRWHRSTLAIWPLVYVVTLCFALNGLRDNYHWGIYTLYESFGKWAALLGIAALLMMAGAVYWMVRFRRLITKNYFKLPLLFLPFLLVTFEQSAMALYQAEPESTFMVKERKYFRAPENTLVPPVVWIIFDELDYRIAFERRPKELLLPELDKLLQTSLSANNAYSPGLETAVSIPALLTGHVLKMTKTIGAGVMELTGIDGTSSTLQTQSTIFADMHNRGQKTALFGWYFPYSRLFSGIDIVRDYPRGLYQGSAQLSEIVALQLRTLVESVYFSPFGDSLVISNHILMTKSINDDVTRYLKTDQSRGFAFMHYPVPHSPNIYNRYTLEFGPNRNVKEGYLDNLALVDVLLGKIRRAMEESGNWDKSLVVVSSDHHLRLDAYDGFINERRVPFIVKLPHQSKGLIVNSRFETVRTRDLILEIVDGKLKTPEDVRYWIGPH